MAEHKSQMKQRLAAGKSVLLAELSPPKSGDPEELRVRAKQYAGKVSALGITDNHGGAAMAALAAAAVVAGEGVEPVLHVITRDRNRNALVADFLGAQALGIRNVLCTSGTHQSLGSSPQSRGVFDLDPVQLLRAYTELGVNGSAAGATALAGVAGAYLGAVASPFADPIELQLLRLGKKIDAGARFLVTQPVFDVDRFGRWWSEVTKRGLDQRASFVVGVQVLTSAEAAEQRAARRPDPAIPESLVATLAAAGDAKAQRAAGIDVATSIVRGLSKLKGLRGFDLRGDGDDAAVLEVIARAQLRS